MLSSYDNFNSDVWELFRKPAQRGWTCASMVLAEQNEAPGIAHRMRHVIAMFFNRVAALRKRLGRACLTRSGAHESATEHSQLNSTDEAERLSFQAKTMRRGF
jgi:hypothetical protein